MEANTNNTSDKVDRIAEWKKFSQHMGEYIRDHTIDKYGIDNSVSGLDLMAITHSPLICVWHILKYSLRIWNNKMKDKDIEKIAHYACLAWCFSSGKIIKKEVRETQ